MGYVEIALIIIAVLYAAYAARQIRAKRLAFEDSDFPTFEEGTPQYVVFGDCWSADWCVIAWGNTRAKKVYKGGWLNKHEAGYRYYATIQMGLGRGPVNAITVTTVGDKLLWCGAQLTQINVGAFNLFGGDEGQGGIVGTLEHFDGNASQVAPPPLVKLLGSKATGCRGVSTVMFDGMLCAMSKSPQPWKFRHWRNTAGWHRDTPWYPAKAEILLRNELADLSDYPAGQRDALRNIHAMNGAHMLFEIATNGAWGRRMDMSELDLASFTALADLLYNEQHGICLRYTRESNLSEFVQTVLDHISAAQFISRQTGLLTVRAIRGDYNVDDLPVFTYDSGLLSIEELDGSTDDAVNVVVVNYKDPVLNESRQVRARNVGAVQATGAMVSTTRDYQGIPVWPLAQRLAERDLRVLTGGTRNFKVTLDRRGYAIEPAGVFVVRAPEDDLPQLVLRAAKLEIGSIKDGKITITCAIDVFGLSATRLTTEPDSAYTRPDNSAVPATAQAAWELSRRDLAMAMSAADLASLPAEAGLVGAVGKRPSVATTDFALATRVGTADFASVADAECAPHGRLSAAVGLSDTAVVLTGATDLEDVLVGSAALLGDELVRIDSIDATTGAVTLGRGCVDTAPVAHAADTPVWLYERQIGIDPVFRSAGQTVNAKLLTRTSGAQLDLADAPTSSVTLASRAARPYLPGRVRVAGVAAPSVVSGEIGIVWAHRNALTQTGELVDHEAASIAAPADVRYALRFLDASGSLLVEKLDIAGESASAVLAVADNSTVTMQLYAINPAGESWQRHVRQFVYTPPAGTTASAITAGSWTPVVTVIDGGLVKP
ncbi:hypothetical protein EAT51_04320 [Pseudoxanthomonas winnipegensis]|uniref:hypothetical protein n=1 Tax=Pseudoxanthomonas winnipegensis TaxID=2480810 RepID=UPI00102DFDDC|nr:hypothetical protein [Pseudoxanthomonas winnipegensis]TAA42930.1 hypothetical protein EAT51_04320 [Pseudoxanthomonas winnipegensis]